MKKYLLAGLVVLAAAMSISAFASEDLGNVAPAGNQSSQNSDGQSVGNFCFWPFC